MEFKSKHSAPCDLRSSLSHTPRGFKSKLKFRLCRMGLGSFKTLLSVDPNEAPWNLARRLNKAHCKLLSTRWDPNFAQCFKGCFGAVS